MDNEPFDNDLFDPPPKQHKQQSSSTSYQQPYTKQQQRQQTTTTTTAAAAAAGATTAYLSATKNASGHPSLPSGIPNSEIQRTTKAAATDASSSVNSGRRSRSPYGDFQYSPKNLTPVSHIVQSGSYVEILKQRSNDISPTHHPANQKRHHQRAIAACHNKSYGDFLTITPRRKGNKLVAAAAGYEQQFNDVGDNLDSYHHRIEPLHLLGLSNEKNYTFLDYRAMEAISNADTLEMGTTLASSNINNHAVGRAHHKNRDRFHANEQDNLNNSTKQQQQQQQQQQQSIAEVSSEYQYFMREKNLSPPSAFSDNISASKKN